MLGSAGLPRPYPDNEWAGLEWLTAFGGVVLIREEYDLLELREDCSELPSRGGLTLLSNVPESTLSEMPLPCETLGTVPGTAGSLRDLGTGECLLTLSREVGVVPNSNGDAEDSVLVTDVLTEGVTPLYFDLPLDDRTPGERESRKLKTGTPYLAGMGVFSDTIGVRESREYGCRGSCASTPSLSAALSPTSPLAGWMGVAFAIPSEEGGVREARFWSAGLIITWLGVSEK
jgi:hypothetical protein